MYFLLNYLSNKPCITDVGIYYLTQIYRYDRQRLKDETANRRDEPICECLGIVVIYQMVRTAYYLI